MNRYVVGFLFNNRSEVCLIEKKRPEWQRGRLNGVGGHIEKDESPEEAIIREFYEETGAHVQKWRRFCFIHGSEYELYCFTSKKDNVHTQTTTDEEVCWYPADALPPNALPNLLWLIPMANYKFDITATVEHENEWC
jgi:8-oxo-dGTP diphosphatase